MAGEDLEEVWRTFRRGKGDLMRDSRAAFDRYGTDCSAQGCHHCTVLSCVYAGFIRHYWKYPHCD